MANGNTLSAIKKPGSPPDSSTIEKTWTHTKVNVVTIHHTWTISNFSLCSIKTGQKLESEIFSAAANDDIKWQLLLYPRGNTEKSKDYISLFLHLVSYKNPHEIAIKSKFVLYNENMEEEISLEFNHVFTEAVGKGFSAFVKRDRLLDVANKLLPNDKLTVHCEVTFSRDTVRTSGEGCSRQLKSSKRHLPENLELLFQEQQFSDVKLIVGNRAFQVHKVILAAFSPVFLAMFNSDMEESKRNSVDIVDTNEETLEKMLQFMYTGKATNIEKLADTLLVAAEKYTLDELKHICEEQLFQSLTVENASSVLILADLHNAEWLKTQTINFIIFQVNGVIKTTSYKSMVVSHPHLLAEIMGAFATKATVQKRQN